MIGIPAGLRFEQLRLAREPDGSVSFDPAIPEMIAEANGLPRDYFWVRPEDAWSELQASWYRSHRSTGGAPDAVMEDLIAEASLEDKHGGGISHAPGRA